MLMADGESTADGKAIAECEGKVEERYTVQREDDALQANKAGNL